jgi:hypothetical protein
LRRNATVARRRALLLIEGSAAAAADAPPHRGRRVVPLRGSDGEDAPSVGVGAALAATWRFPLRLAARRHDWEMMDGCSGGSLH